MDDRTLGHGAEPSTRAGSVEGLGGDGPAATPAGDAWAGDLERLAPAALDAALEAVGAPTFLVRAPATVLRSNASGTALLAADPAGVDSGLREASGGPRAPRRFTVREAGHFLAVFPDARRDAVARAPALAGRWRLTPRQTAVLALVAEGSTNRVVAQRLGCSEKTVELHVSALLSKARCATRSQLVAAFWTHPDLPHPE